MIKITKRWKVAFFSVTAFLFLVIISLGIIVFMFFTTNEQEEQQNYEAYHFTGETIFTVHTTKNQLNGIIQSQLEKLKYNRENVDFTVVLEDKVNVTGYLMIFNREVSFRMLLEPVVQENGDLFLKQESFHIGKLLVPSKQVLQFISTSTKLPEWVVIAPEDGMIYIALNKIEVSDGLRVKARMINLSEDEIMFDLYYTLFE